MSAYGEISTVWVGLIHIAQNKIIELSTKNVAQIKPAYQEVLKFLSLYPPMGFLFSKQSLVEKYKVNVKHPVGSRINTPRKEY